MKTFEAKFSVVRPTTDLYAIKINAPNIDEAEILFEEFVDKFYSGEMSLFKDCEYIDTPDVYDEYDCIEDICLDEITELEDE